MQQTSTAYADTRHLGRRREKDGRSPEEEEGEATACYHAKAENRRKPGEAVRRNDQNFELEYGVIRNDNIGLDHLPLSA